MLPKLLELRIWIKPFGLGCRNSTRTSRIAADLKLSSFSAGVVSLDKIFVSNHLVRLGVPVCINNGDLYGSAPRVRKLLAGMLPLLVGSSLRLV